MDSKFHETSKSFRIWSLIHTDNFTCLRLFVVHLHFYMRNTSKCILNIFDAVKNKYSKMMILEISLLCTPEIFKKMS